MKDQDFVSIGFDAVQYLKSQTELEMLKSRLPDGSVETIAREVIRRLSVHDVPDPLRSPPEEQIEALCHALLSEDDTAGARFITDLRTGGTSIEGAYLTYLAGAARMLGAWWNTDRLAFTEVTLGTTRMYAIMRALRHQFSDTYDSPSRSAVFASVPGETHTLGVRMAADLFSKEGWDIDLMIHKSHEELVDDICAAQPILIGISAGGDHVVEPLSKLIIALRISVPRAWIFLSGNIIDEAKDAIDLMGVDGIVKDVTDARYLMSAVWDAVDTSSRDPEKKTPAKPLR
ncbi:B12 binding domain-containing protein [Jannaschia faecimaris]|uniref:B12 binding domain-containing protein n=1 Tax=Jannaschia faecimaris TaxID=1244108 RepID=A0A1H3U5A2_9RHOB|nr:cobalamin-dependent protein [Jannaschia faecimaris]SDZ57656.1 B12 binding domain-containing protein [Jannaschia faecimaris]